MALNVENSTNFHICVGCLSGDRVLRVVDEQECIQYFLGFIEPLSIPEPLTLCWECRASLRNSLEFRKQVKVAFKQFAVFMINQNMKTIATLSRLTKATIRDFTKIYSEGPVEEVSSNESQQFKPEEIKLEADFDEVFADEYDEELKIEEVSVNKTDNFSESDDEPLSSKKTLKKSRKISSEKSFKDKKRKRRKDASGVIDNARTRKKLKELNIEDGSIEMVLLSWEEVEQERQKILQSPSFNLHRHSCRRCAVGFNHRAKHDSHLANKHDSSRGGLICDFCEVYCRDAKALSAHRRRHQARWRCAPCGALYSRATVAADHAARAHCKASTVSHRCARCGHVASSLSRLRQHLRTHSERLKCELCEKSFAGRSALNTHLFIHRGEKEHACPKCDKKFLFKRTMQVHLLTHNADQSFYCREKCSTRTVLRAHVRTVHRGGRRARNHVCHYCGKAYGSAALLSGHLRGHAGSEANREMALSSHARNIQEVKKPLPALEESKKYISYVNKVLKD